MNKIENEGVFDSKYDMSDTLTVTIEKTDDSGFSWESMNRDLVLPELIEKKLNIVLTHDLKFLKTYQKGKMYFEIELGNLIYPVEHYKTPEGVYLTEFKMLIKDSFHLFTIPSSVISSSRFFEEACKYGFSAPALDEERKYLKELIMSLHTYLVNTKSPLPCSNQMGWHGNDFIIGNKKITKDEIIEFNIPNTNDQKNLFLSYNEIGEYELYKKAVDNVYSEKDYLKQTIFHLYGLANPLYEVLGRDGVSCNLRSEYSGNGKTAGLLFAMSSFTKPRKISEFTEVGLFNKATSLKDLPIFVDEISTMMTDDPKLISNIIYQITCGSAKMKGTQAGGNVTEKFFKSQMASTSNPDMDVLVDKEPAKANRSYQITIDKEFKQSELKVLSNSISLLEENHGWGYIYIASVVKNREIIKKELQLLQEKFDDAFENANFRFFSSSFACMITAAKIQKKLGFKINPQEIEDFFFNIEVPRIKKSIKESKITAEYIIYEYLLEHTKDLCQMNKTIGGIKAIDDFQPKVFQSVLILGINELRINRAFFNKFLSKHPKFKNGKISEIKKIFDNDKVDFIEKKASISGISMPCIIINMPDSMIQKTSKDSLFVIDRKQEDDDDKVRLSLGN